MTCNVSQPTHPILSSVHRVMKIQLVNESIKRFWKVLTHPRCEAIMRQPVCLDL